MTTDSTVGSITDDLLWSECPEELYLRRILQEQYQDEGTIVDSVMGQSTVAGILSDDRNKSIKDEDRYDGRSWLNFSPIAGSVVTEATTSEEESSPSFVESSVESRMIRVRSSEEKPIEEAATNVIHDIKKSLPPDITPRFIDFDEESMGSLSVIHIPEVVDLPESYDEEATEVDGTRGGLSTLSGDTFLRNIGLQMQPDYVRSWVHAKDIAYAKPKTDGIGATSKSSKQDSSNGGNKQSHSLGYASRESTSQTTNNSKEGCCSRFIQRMIDDDKVFRRTILIAVLFIVLFLSLSAFALIRSSDVLLSSDNQAASMPTLNPTSYVSSTSENHTDDQSTEFDGLEITPPPTTSDLVAQIVHSETPSTVAPSLSPNGNSAEEISVQVPMDPPTSAPTISDLFRFVSNLINLRSPSSMGLIGNSQSPHNQAFLWIIDDLQGSTETSEERILQRWTLALFFFSLNGEFWTNSDGWLTEQDVCTWFTTSAESICNEMGLFTHLELVDNNLQGSLPRELELLSGSLVGINLDNNRISGPLPSELSNISSLGTCTNGILSSTAIFAII